MLCFILLPVFVFLPDYPPVVSSFSPPVGIFLIHLFSVQFLFVLIEFFYLPPHFFCFLSVFVQWNWLFHIKACLLLVLSTSLKYCICLRSVLKHTQPESVNIWHHLRPQGLSLDTLWQHFPASDAWPKQYAPSDDHTSNWINATRTNMAARFGNVLLYYKK